MIKQCRKLTVDYRREGRCKLNNKQCNQEMCSRIRWEGELFFKRELFRAGALSRYDVTASLRTWTKHELEREPESTVVNGIIAYQKVYRAKLKPSKKLKADHQGVVRAALGAW